MVRSRRGRVILLGAGTIVGILLTLQTLNIRHASAAPSAEEIAKKMTTIFLAALNTKNGGLLAGLYADSPALLCTDLDVLIANELSGRQVTGIPLVLKQLVKSTATMTPPGAASSPIRGIIAVFSVAWTHRLPNEEKDRILNAEVEWAIEQKGDEYKITDQRTRDRDESTCY